MNSEERELRISCVEAQVAALEKTAKDQKEEIAFLYKATRDLASLCARQAEVIERLKNGGKKCQL